MTDLERFELARAEWSNSHFVEEDFDKSEILDAGYNPCDEMGWVD